MQAEAIADLQIGSGEEDLKERCLPRIQKRRDLDLVQNLNLSLRDEGRGLHVGRYTLRLVQKAACSLPLWSPQLSGRASFFGNAATIRSRPYLSSIRKAVRSGVK